MMKASIPDKFILDLSMFQLDTLVLLKVSHHFMSTYVNTSRHKVSMDGYSQSSPPYAMLKVNLPFPTCLPCETWKNINGSILHGDKTIAI